MRRVHSVSSSCTRPAVGAGPRQQQNANGTEPSVSTLRFALEMRSTTPLGRADTPYRRLPNDLGCSGSWNFRSASAYRVAVPEKATFVRPVVHRREICVVSWVLVTFTDEPPVLLKEPLPTLPLEYEI
jgi:hypothetical protein